MRHAASIAVMIVLGLTTAAGADPAMIERLCTRTDCGGSFARLEVLTDAGGAIAKYRYRGDVRTCSHPPLVYIDTSGVEIASAGTGPAFEISNRAAIDAFHAEQLKGLSVREEIACARYFPFTPPR